jgi:formylglycine-generating enzyme required for sulfatase activity
MLGLVYEWCADEWENAGQRIIRGGSYHEPASCARASAFKLRHPAQPSSRVGFRIVLGPRLEAAR